MKIYGITSDGNVTVSGSLVVSGSITGSDGIVHALTASNAVTSSYALTASYASLDSSSLVTATTFNTFTSSYSTGSFTGSFTGSLSGTASWSQNASTASYVLNSVSSSFASTASYVQQAISASYATTASFVLNAVSASFATSASRATTSSFAITASHATSVSPLVQNVIVTGSLTVTDDLIIQGSASIQYVTSSQLNIFDNIISVNTLTPSIRFGGLAVIDSGSSPQQSGSLLFDSQNNQWIFVHQSSGAVTSSILLMGPQTFNNVGGETAITNNRLTKGAGVDLGEHLTDSNITDTGTLVSINSNTQVTGSLITTAGITGSVFGTASWANNSTSASNAATASFLLGSIASASYAVTASYSATASFLTGAVTSASYALSSSLAQTASLALRASGSLTGSLLGTATTASYVLNAVSSSFATTAQNATTASYITLAQTASFVTLAQTSSLALRASGSLTGSLLGIATTASFVTTAQTASYVTWANVVETTTDVFLGTASFVTTAQTASFVITAQTASFVTLAQTSSLALRASGSLTGSLLGTASTASFVTLAQTASYVLNAVSASFVTSAATASFVTTAQTASFIAWANVSESVTDTFLGTASFVTTAATASFITTAQTASFVTLAQTASLALRASGSLTGSLLGTATTASYVLNAVSSSFATTAQTASFVTLAQTASYVLNAVSASFVTSAATASYVLNAVSSSFTTTAQTASTILTARTASNVDFYPTFVDSNNTPASAEQVYTNAGFLFNPAANSLQVGTITASLSGTASFAISSSFAISASRAVSSSFATTASFTISSSFAATAETAQTASFVRVVNDTESATPLYLTAIDSNNGANTPEQLKNTSLTFTPDTNVLSVGGGAIIAGTFTTQLPAGVAFFGTASQALTASYYAGTVSDLGTNPITVVAATTANLNAVYSNGVSGVGASLSGSAVGVLPTIDGVTLTTADNVLIKNQASGLQNGVYDVVSVGSGATRWILSRSLAADETAEFDPQIVVPAQGATNVGVLFAQTTDNPTIGTSAIVYSPTTTNQYVTQVTTGTQTLYNIPWWTGTAKQLSKGTSNLQFNSANSQLTLIGSLNQGDSTAANGNSSHAEGIQTFASGAYSHAEGSRTIASGFGSHAEGFNTVASGSYQHVQGQYNISSSAQSAFIVGNGTSLAARSNLIFASGSRVEITGSLTVTQNITGSAVLISGSNTTALLKITQGGAGNALIIEDAASDATPFIVDANGNVAIGKTAVAAGVKLDVSGSLYIEKNDDSGLPVFSLYNLYDYTTVGKAHRGIQFISKISGSATYIQRNFKNGGSDQDNGAVFTNWIGDVLLERGSYNTGGANASIAITKGWKWAAFNAGIYQTYMVLTASGSASDGFLGLGTETPGFQLTLSTDSAAKPSTNTWTISSDQRLKENIEEANYDTCYDIVKNLPLKRYTWKSEVYTTKQVKDRSKLGWIAQDVETVFPKAVDTASFSGSGDFYIEDCKNLNADQVYAAMYGTIKKLIQTNETLQERVTTLESELQAIKTHLGL